MWWVCGLLWSTGCGFVVSLWSGLGGVVVVSVGSVGGGLEEYLDHATRITTSRGVASAPRCGATLHAFLCLALQAQGKPRGPAWARASPPLVFV